MITNDIPNGTILISSITKATLLVARLNTGAHWGYDLDTHSCWLYPNDEVVNTFVHNPYIIQPKYMWKARLLLGILFDIRSMTNLDYIEALAKIKEYEKETP